MKVKLLLVCFMVLLASIAEPVDNLTRPDPVQDSFPKRAACKTCLGTLKYMNRFFKTGVPEQIVHFTLGAVCTATLFKWTQCFKLVNAYSPLVTKGLKEKILEPNYFCEVTLQVCPAKHYKRLDPEDDVKRLLSDKPDIIKENNYIDNLYKEIKADKEAGIKRNTMMMYHITDVHINIDYKEGYSNVCEYFVCCIPEAGEGKTKEERAGKWGDYKCDTNPAVLEKIEDLTKETGMPDIVTWTGDSTGHTIFNNPFVTTKGSIVVTEAFERIFDDSVMFAIHGNHEFAPFNIQDMSTDFDEVIELIADDWRSWMTPEVYDEYKERTYFSYDAQTHPKATPDFKRKMGKTRIISLNTQNCYNFNFALMSEENDPGQEFEWLENLLRQMEKDGEIGILIGHIPLGNLDCIHEVGVRMKALQERFQHVIRINLFGHTHYEEFEVHRSFGDEKPIGTSHVTPSITTHQYQNPSLRVLILDEETKLPLEVKTYTFYVDKANKHDRDAKFVLDHELSEHYGVEDLSPSSMLEISERIIDDEEMGIKYNINRRAGSPLAHEDVKDGCDRDCRWIIHCNTAYNDYHDKLHCMRFHNRGALDWLSHVFDFFHGGWVEKLHPAEGSD